MRTLRTAALEKARDGVTTLEQVLVVTAGAT
jgi:type II secretory ATPase GspE/PulE/Tfp pilus assembly ATPase PilB-like protein